MIFLHAIELDKRYTASKMEYYLKTIVKQLNVKFEYEKKKECAIVVEENFNILINKVKDGLNSMEDEEIEEDNEKYIDDQKEIPNKEIDMRKLELDQEIEMKKLDNNNEIEMKKLDQEKELRIIKIQNILELFKNKLITLEDYKDLLKNV